MKISHSGDHSLVQNFNPRGNSSRLLWLHKGEQFLVDEYRHSEFIDLFVKLHGPKNDKDRITISFHKKADMPSCKKEILFESGLHSIVRHTSDSNDREPYDSFYWLYDGVVILEVAYMFASEDMKLANFQKYGKNNIDYWTSIIQKLEEVGFVSKREIVEKDYDWALLQTKKDMLAHKHMVLKTIVFSEEEPSFGDIANNLVPELWNVDQLQSLLEAVCKLGIYSSAGNSILLTPVERHDTAPGLNATLMDRIKNMEWNKE